MSQDDDELEGRKRPRVQYSLNLALVGLTLVCIAMAWYHWTQRFARAAQAMEKMQVTVSYDEASNNRERPQPHKVPKWRGRIFGEDFCFRMSRLDIYAKSVETSPTFWNDLAKHRSAMPEVEVVQLGGTVVDGQTIDALKHLPLVEIYFYSCTFEPGVLGRLQEFPKLRTIVFGGIKQELDYRELAVVGQLTLIGLKDCKIDLETAEFLRAELLETYVFAF